MQLRSSTTAHRKETRRPIVLEQARQKMATGGMMFFDVKGDESFYHDIEVLADDYGMYIQKITATLKDRGVVNGINVYRPFHHIGATEWPNVG